MRVVEPQPMMGSQFLFIFFLVGEVGESERFDCYEEVEPLPTPQFTVSHVYRRITQHIEMIAWKTGDGSW
jgi:hypothetical protein